jgi:hypothetical protein
MCLNRVNRLYATIQVEPGELVATAAYSSSTGLNTNTGKETLQHQVS